MTRYTTLRAKTNDELQAFLQAIEWVNSPHISILDENPRTCEALICDTDAVDEDDVEIIINGD